ncbi:MAG: endonuclease/exonuclease/phosphatase family protein [Promethearchaeota archaeon]
MASTKKRRLTTICVLTFFVIMIGFSPGMVQAYDNPDYTIPEIQGDGFTPTIPSSMYIDTWGVVTADYQDEVKRGFFVQDPVGDGNPATSDGIFVYKYDYDVQVGDYVKLQGKVSEYYGMTQMYKPYVTIEDTGYPLPEPVELNPPVDDYASDVYYEALEGMLVCAPELRVVAGTDSYGEFAGVVADSGITRVFENDPIGTGEIIFADDSGGLVVNVRTGTLVKNLYGPLDYTFDEYKIQPSVDYPPEIVNDWWAESECVWPRGLTFGLTVATYNMYNLYDEFDDPDKADTVYSPEYVELQLTKHALAIKEMLRMPDIIAVQEVENFEILERLTKTKPIQGKYGVVLIEGPYDRAVDVGLLYLKNRVTIVSAEARQTCTDLDDGYGPGTDPNFPCPEGYNALFSRPPLVVHLKTHGKWYCGRHGGGNDLWLIINHFKSKSTYAPTYADTEPRRIQQAAWVGSLVDEIQEANCKAKVIVLGDLNSYENEAPITTLIDGGLTDLVFEVNRRSRYSYIYRGLSGVLDHIMITPSLHRSFLFARFVHFNTDFPFFLWSGDPSTAIRSTDHDIFMASFWIR